MELNVRDLRDEDYTTIAKWWKHWQWPVVPKYNLPPTGLIVEKTHIEKDGKELNLMEFGKAV